MSAPAIKLMIHLLTTHIVHYDIYKVALFFKTVILIYIRNKKTLKSDNIVIYTFIFGIKFPPKQRGESLQVS